jgi:HicB_like antitoxin of bacterial toxin-antitoxin system
VTAGRSLDEARTMAAEALKFHVEGMTEDGEAIPEPSTLEAVMADPRNRDGVAILVALEEEGTQAVRVNVTMPKDLLAAIDRYAEAHGFTRSGFLTQAARRALETA